jgi:hypothetical protein
MARSDADSQLDTAVTFSALVRRFAEVIAGGNATGLDLLRELRSALADLYAEGPRLPDLPPINGPRARIKLIPESDQEEITASLERQLPREIYWSGLLPLTYLTVGDAGVTQLAEDLCEIYAWLTPGLVLFDANGPIREVVAWWANWETTWGTPTVRCLKILHEVITDLELDIYGNLGK